ncbi:hypothetical protein RhiXN_03235 [Rhizoctonia solani]|uniref:Uncharacterized protein n=1 Tax=Rhizoctonia solani TaxID=456999 RepID=A0A8H8STW2_9AGAM|nr:uncharacterized protein RhiXN_03235 [Rhizoctonia solani]QRW18311.1 hypothetical protein RhiXN_03235 [Rhizoctonia solani]
MIQALQNHQKKWQRIELGEPKFIEFPDPHDTVTYFADNLYAYYHRTGRESDGSSCCTLRLYLLPSLNTGIEFNTGTMTSWIPSCEPLQRSPGLTCWFFLSLVLTRMTEAVSNSEGPALIPWEVWGSCTICLPDTELPDIILHGGKYLFLRGSSAPHSPDDSLFPILSQAKVPNSGNWVCTSKSNQDTTSREPSYAYTIDCRTPVQESHELGILGEALPDIRAYCKKTAVNVDEETKCNINDYDVMANDEHFAIYTWENDTKEISAVFVSIRYDR